MRQPRKAILTILSVAAMLALALAPGGCKDSNTITGNDGAVSPTPTEPPGYSVSGTVRGGGGAVLGASVSVSSGSVTRRASTASDGSYLVSGIPAGTATVNVSHRDYRPGTTQVTLPPNAMGVDFRLRPAS